MKQTTIVAIILAVLLLVSVVQAFQLTSLKSKIVDGKVSLGATKSSTPLATGGSSTGSLPSSIKDLPQMVGGC